MNTFSIAIHGGAGALTDVEKYRIKISEILIQTANFAVGTVTALKIAEYAVALLEDEPLFNAGKGSVLNALGRVECDAAIMDGRTMTAGAVAAVTGIKNPIVLARGVMEKSPHVMLIGRGAEEFGARIGVATEPPEYFVTESRLKQLAEAQAQSVIVLDHSDVREEKLGTVGAVVIDRFGHLAAATSTGGIVNKQFGRVGDSPIVGAGVYAENGICAVSATGYGEQFIRTALSKHIAEIIRYQQIDAMSAAEQGINYLIEKVQGIGGVIVVDSEYRIGFAHSTPLILAGSITDKHLSPELFF